MRFFVIALILLLALSGLGLYLLRDPANLALAQWLPSSRLLSTQRILYLLHLWLSCLFLVGLPLYAWDHIRQQKHWLKVLRLTSVSGGLQLLAAVILMVSGLLLFLFDAGFGAQLLGWHAYATWALLLGLGLHALASKRY